jgi:hypothetical protein
MSLNNNCLGTTSGCKVNFIYNLYQQPELIPDPASQALTTVNCGIWDQE